MKRFTMIPLLLGLMTLLLLTFSPVKNADG